MKVIKKKSKVHLKKIYKNNKKWEYKNKLYYQEN